ncbi:MAG: class I mannose-6-phosphate isomerase [Gemmiger sp.]|nr:class I mannose-6-phosphate isomerase [Gemmiger sp.]
MPAKQANTASPCRPVTEITPHPASARRGAAPVAAALGAQIATVAPTVTVVECYPGTDQQEVLALFESAGIPFATVLHADDYALAPEALDESLARELTEDRVFGVMTNRTLADCFAPAALAEARRAVAAATKTGRVLVYGVGATLIAADFAANFAENALLFYADITRWEIQLRYRRGMDNWRTAQTGLPQLAKYKRGFFAEWRWGDLVKKQCLPRLAGYLDMTVAGEPGFVAGEDYRHALAVLAARPFRLVPYYDPGVWGGHWMQSKFSLPENGSNYAWSFDGVPEENSLLLGFGGTEIETPAINLVFAQPRALLGERVYARFGAEFPIRFDLLDTIGGQNLSLQVHPLTEYIQDTYHMHYTQDESYYILDTEGENPEVWLGLREDICPEAMAGALRAAQRGECSFDAGQYANHFPVKKHDHVLIPAGTVHGAGAGTMVLEISATPYIFTFKLWDWGRLGLDGKPRPIHVEQGLENIQWDRTTAWVENNLLHQARVVHQSSACTVEKTGLDEREFIDTYRITTATAAPIRRNGSVHMLNLVEGAEARITSPSGSFPPFTVRYAQTFILPQNAGEYQIEAVNGQPIRAILACVRG